jgi:hypothetical protein
MASEIFKESYSVSAGVCCTVAGKGHGNIFFIVSQGLEIVSQGLELIFSAVRNFKFRHMFAEITSFVV